MIFSSGEIKHGHQNKTCQILAGFVVLYKIYRIFGWNLKKGSMNNGKCKLSRRVDNDSLSDDTADKNKVKALNTDGKALKFAQCYKLGFGFRHVNKFLSNIFNLISEYYPVVFELLLVLVWILFLLNTLLGGRNYQVLILLLLTEILYPQLSKE